MARLARYTQQLFASTAGVNQIAEFGAFAAGSPGNTYSGSTITPAIIQTLANYLQGWFAAVEGAYSPAIEDMNALFYLGFYQLCYGYQAGVPEWDSATTYYTGSIVQSSGVMYVSIVDTNLNQAITDSTKWFSITQYGSLLQQALNGSMTLPAFKTMMWSQMPITTGLTVTVSNDARLACEGQIVITGTGSLVVTGTGVARVF